MNRMSRAQMGQETLAILNAGGYPLPSGAKVELRSQLNAARAHTESYPPDAALPSFVSRQFDTVFEVRNENTLTAARRLAAAGERVAALNFASAKNPGGGFLSGARAQEESLARASGLVACLQENPMYAFHRERHDPLYTSYAIYSPDVPVFRDEDGSLLGEPYLVSFITAPAPNTKVVLQRDPSRHSEVSSALRERVGKVLAIAAGHGHETLVLGAWGCGVFGNSTVEVAGLFRDAFAAEFRGVFRAVVFAMGGNQMCGRRQVQLTQ